MISKKVTDLLNDQVNLELYSAYLYLDFSNYYKDAGLDGYAHWYMIQAQEERDHAMLLVQYLRQQGLPITLESIDKPDRKYKTFADPLKVGAEHELTITDSIYNIYMAAWEERDFRTMEFLDWYVKEQAEEEDNADYNVIRYELFGKDRAGLYDLDAEMGRRVYAPPSLVID